MSLYRKRPILNFDELLTFTRINLSFSGIIKTVTYCLAFCLQHQRKRDLMNSHYLCKVTGNVNEIETGGRFDHIWTQGNSCIGATVNFLELKLTVPGCFIRASVNFLELELTVPGQRGIICKVTHLSSPPNVCVCAHMCVCAWVYIHIICPIVDFCIHDLHEEKIKSYDLIDEFWCQTI